MVLGRLVAEPVEHGHGPHRREPVVGADEPDQPRVARPRKLRGAFVLVEQRDEQIARLRHDEDSAEALDVRTAEAPGRIEVDQPGRIVRDVTVALDDLDRSVELRHVEQRVVRPSTRIGHEGDVDRQPEARGNLFHFEPGRDLPLVRTGLGRREWGLGRELLRRPVPVEVVVAVLEPHSEHVRRRVEECRPAGVAPLEDAVGEMDVNLVGTAGAGRAPDDLCGAPDLPVRARVRAPVGIAEACRLHMHVPGRRLEAQPRLRDHRRPRGVAGAPRCRLGRAIHPGRGRGQDEHDG